MTTIAYKDGVLAADSMTHDGQVKVTCLPKLLRIPGGRVAIAGPYATGLALIKWLAADGEEVHAPNFDDFGAIVVWDTGPHAGEIWVYDECPVPICWPADAEYALGSGAQAALGAMRAGATAEAAVEIAASIDPNSGIPVAILQPLGKLPIISPGPL